MKTGAKVLLVLSIMTIFSLWSIRGSINNFMENEIKENSKYNLKDIYSALSWINFILFLHYFLVSFIIIATYS